MYNCIEKTVSWQWAFGSLALEAVADHTLWFWHESFGFPGTLNDINAWERSTWLESMTNGEHHSIDCDFVVNGLFSKLFYFVDGTCPHLTWFLGTEPDPSAKLDGSLVTDQEGSRKHVEHWYGVLILKFLSVTHPITLHHHVTIYSMVLATIFLHSMMVESRLKLMKEKMILCTTSLAMKWTTKTKYLGSMAILRWMMIEFRILMRQSRTILMTMT